MRTDTDKTVVRRRTPSELGRRSLRSFAVPAAAALIVATCANGDDSDADVVPADDQVDDGVADEGTVELVDPYDGHTSEVYGETTHWICHPDLDNDACDDLTAMVLGADGSTEPGDLAAATDPGVDCFYVYPTVSAHPDTNSTLEPGNEEISTVEAQAAPFAATCRVFAPVYRQITLAGLAGGGFDDEEARELAYGDVADAWRTYVSQHNEGRGIALIGHSQGAGHLNRLIAEEIDSEPALRERLVSAILLGSPVAVPEGEDVGGDFEKIPVCQEIRQVGCVISFASYPADSPPQGDAMFGRVADADLRAICSDPVALAGDDAATTIIRTEGLLVAASGLAGDVEVADPDVRYLVLPEVLQVSCERSDDHDYLAASLVPGEERDVGALVEEFEAFGIQWGLHLLDVNLALGNLLDIVAEQSEAFAGSAA